MFPARFSTKFCVLETKDALQSFAVNCEKYIGTGVIGVCPDFLSVFVAQRRQSKLARGAGGMLNLGNLNLYNEETCIEI